jgi:hypothetical protein
MKSMEHAVRNLGVRGIARRVALGRWDYSTIHILGLSFVRSFLGRGFVLASEPEFFWSKRRWTMARQTDQGYVYAVEVSIIGGELRASSFIQSTADGTDERLAESVYVPDDSLSTERMNGSEKAKLLLDRMAAYSRSVNV